MLAPHMEHQGLWNWTWSLHVHIDNQVNTMMMLLKNHLETITKYMHEKYFLDLWKQMQNINEQKHPSIQLIVKLEAHLTIVSLFYKFATSQTKTKWSIWVC